MSEALRFNSDKPMMSYFMRSFPKMAEAVARVKEMGAIKYDDGNWRLGNKPDGEYWDSMFRHLTYIFGGEDYDKDTGCLHIAHAVWNLCALLELNHPDLPARDEAIWAERAVHWADEKRKREEKLDREGDEADEVSQYGVSLEDVESVEGLGAALVARWAREVEEEKWEPEAADEVEPPAVEPPEFAVCPMCSCTFARRVRYGLECGECGEIFDVPIGPETGASEGVAYTEMPKFIKEPKFDIPDGFSPVFSKFVRMIAVADDKVRSQYAAHCEEQKRNDAADAAVYSAACAERIMEDLMPKECPQCGSSRTMQDGERGITCLDCGEAFEVPIVPENTPLYKDVKFTIRYDKPSPEFKALMNRIFKTVEGRE